MPLARLAPLATRRARRHRLATGLLLVAALLAVGLAQLLTLLIGDAALYDLTTANTVFIAAGVAGFVGYVWGWWALIGFDREPGAMLGRRAVYFLMVGVVILVALLIWLVINLIIAALPPQIPL